MSTSDLVIWLSTGVLFAAVGLVAVVAFLERALPRRDFDLDRFLAEAQVQVSSNTDSRR